MTDGCINVQPKRIITTLSSKDIDWLEIIKLHICSDMKIYSHNKQCGVLQINSKEIGNLLINKGCTPRKSLTLQFPEIPTNYLPDFIRGCIDGDGCIHIGKYERKRHSNIINYTSRTCTIVSASKDFLTKLDQLLTDNNINHCFRSRKQKPSKIGNRIINSTNLIYSIQVRDQSAYKFLKWIYYPNHTLSMKRKNMLAQQIIDYYELEHKPRRLLPVPNKEWLENELMITPITTIARNLSVTDKVIRRWIKIHNLKSPGPGYWTQFRY